MSEKKLTITETGTFKVRGVNDITVEVKYYSDYSNEITLYSLSKNICRVIDLYPEPEKFGPFSNLLLIEGGMKDLLVSMGVTDFHDIDMDYILNHSGSKLISKLVKYLIMKNDVTESGVYPLTAESYKVFSNVIINRFYIKWKRLWETLTKEYDFTSPLMIDTDEKITNTMDSANTHKGTNEYTDKSSTYGFDTEDAKPVDEDYSKDSTNRTETYHRDNPITRKTQRKGNIGNLTPQELIDKQRKTLQWQFWNVAFEDVDSVISNGYYK